MTDHIRALCRILSNEDAMYLFTNADGMTYTKAKEERGLSKKRFYQRLHEMVKEGLMYKQKGTGYYHTAYGDLVARYMSSLEADISTLMKHNLAKLSSTEANARYIESQSMHEDSASIEQALGRKVEEGTEVKPNIEKNKE